MSDSFFALTEQLDQGRIPFNGRNIWKAFVFGSLFGGLCCVTLWSLPSRVKPDVYPISMSAAYNRPVMSSPFAQPVKALLPSWQAPKRWQPARAEGEAAEGLELTDPMAANTEAVSSSAPDAMHMRRQVLRTASIASLGVAAEMHGMHAKAAKKREWKPIDLPVDPELKSRTILFDIEFDDKDPKKGVLVGNLGTFFTTVDGGKTWTPQSPGRLGADKKQKYSFVGCSYKGGEGWVIGKPSILLHTTNGGESWQRIPLSPKLPGIPNSITALGDGKAELTTDAGAIYATVNTGRNWTAQVQESIDATLNRVSSSGVSGASYYSGKIVSIKRDEDGSRLAVSSRGNFYLTWKPGDDFWIPHNRGVRRLISSMGVVGNKIDQGIWLSTAAGEIWKAPAGNNMGTEDLTFQEQKINAGGYSLLDVNFRPDGKTAWAVGGSGKIFESKNGGASWSQDKAAEDLPTNLYKIKFFGDEGYILGSGGIALKY